MDPLSYADDVTAARAAVAAATLAVTTADLAAEAAHAALTVAEAVYDDAQADLDEANRVLTELLNNPPPPPVVKHALLGMSAPVSEWDTRVKEVGPGLQARRLFYTSFTASLSNATAAVKAGQLPVCSWKVPSWSGVASGQYDAELIALGKRLAALGGPVAVALHHEPAGDGTPAAWAAMQTHALPLLRQGPTIQTSVIGNGWWFNTKGGLSDAEINAYIPASVKAVADVVAADTYQMQAGAEGPGPKMKNMAAWALRVGGVKALGVGEFNAQSATDITQACAALKAEPLFAWGLLWNADKAPVTHLTGDRLTAFKVALANWNT